VRCLISVVLILGVLGGCSARYQDVSGTPEYTGRIGEVCITTAALIAHGVSRQLGKEKKTDYLVITREPGFAGPEVTFREALPAGVALTIIAARRCTNCLPPYVDFIVTSPALLAFHQYEIAAHEGIFQPKAKSCRKI
jgi:hypothetical protein